MPVLCVLFSAFIAAFTAAYYGLQRVRFTDDAIKVYKAECACSRPQATTLHPVSS